MAAFQCLQQPGQIAIFVAIGRDTFSLFIRLPRRQSFYVFSYYTWAMGLLFLLWLALR